MLRICSVRYANYSDQEVNYFSAGLHTTREGKFLPFNYGVIHMEHRTTIIGHL